MNLSSEEEEGQIDRHKVDREGDSVMGDAATESIGCSPTVEELFSPHSP